MQEEKRLEQEVVKTTKIKAAQPLARPIVSKQKLQAFVNAENVSPADSTLLGVTMIAYDEFGRRTFLMFADRLTFNKGIDLSAIAAKGSLDWKVRGHVTIMPADLSTVIHVDDKVWPTEMPSIGQTFTQLTADRDDDFDSQTMTQLRAAIYFHRQQGDKTAEVLHNYEYGYWNKIAIPLAAISFGVLGAVLGIRNHRTGTATGFALAVAIIFGYDLLANFMNVWAMGGFIPAWAASFAPLAIGVVASGVIIWRRNG
jgi:lipopolysaccharide export system permease protein